MTDFERACELIDDAANPSEAEHLLAEAGIEYRSVRTPVYLGSDRDGKSKGFRTSLLVRNGRNWDSVITFTD